MCAKSSSKTLDKVKKYKSGNFTVNVLPLFNQIPTINVNSKLSIVGNKHSSMRQKSNK